MFFRSKHIVFFGSMFLGSPWYWVHGLHVMKPIKGLVNSIVNGLGGKW
jgi:hypothetical protein